MTVMTKEIRNHLVWDGVMEERTVPTSRRSPIRPCMIVSVALILAGMGLVILMLLRFIPVTFLTAFLGFALTASGGTMSLIFCGDI